MFSHKDVLPSGRILVFMITLGKTFFYLSVSTFIIASNVGERIRYFRNLRGWSQETLALQAEINPAFLGHLERGLKSPTIKTLEKIVRALDISLAELFADPQPVDNAKDAVIAQVCDQIRDLPLESIERINVIVRNVLAIEK